jgi:hypothetical protein
MSRAFATAALGVATLTVLSSMPGTASAADPTARAQPAARSAASAAPSVALMDAANGKADVVGGVRVGPPTLIRTLAGATSILRGTAITPDGSTGLVANQSDTVVPIEGLRTAPTHATPIDLSAFKLEGSPDARVLSESVALGPRFGLVATAEQGLVQLVRSGSTWAVDGRVHSAGRNSVGKHHKPGFIALPAVVKGATAYTSVSVARSPLSNGKYLAVAIDRVDGAVAVIEGVGTAKPKVMSVVTRKALKGTQDATGSAATAFVSSSPNRVVLGTPTGVAVLNLRHVKKPELQAVTRLGPSNGVTSLAVSPNGDYVAVGAGRTVYLLKGLLAAASTGDALAQSRALNLASKPGETVRALAFTDNASLLVQYSNNTGGGLLIFRKATSQLLPSGSLAMHTGLLNGTLSVWPSARTPSFRPTHRVAHGHVGHRFHLKLAIKHGVGTYHFAVIKGHLPAGLKLHGKAVVGTPTKASHRTVRIAATNQVGGTISKRYKVIVGS